MVDTRRPSSCRRFDRLSLELVGAEVAQGGVTTFAVIEHLDVEVYTPLRLLVGSVVITANSFGLQLAEETLGRGIVPAVAATAHALPDPEKRQAVAEGAGGVLAAAIAVKDQLAAGAAMGDGHVESLQDQFRPHVVGHRPTDDLARKEVEDRADVEPPFVGRNVGDVGDPLLVRPRRREITVQEVLGHGQSVVRIGRRRHEARRGVGLKPLLAEGRRLRLNAP
jgi:hypothetical protein